MAIAIKKMKDMVDESAFKLVESQTETNDQRKQNLILKQLNQFHQSAENKEDKALYNHNFSLKQEIIKMDNIIDELKKTIEKLKNAKRGETLLLDKIVMEPTPEVLKIIN